VRLRRTSRSRQDSLSGSPAQAHAVRGNLKKKKKSDKKGKSLKMKYLGFKYGFGEKSLLARN